MKKLLFGLLVLLSSSGHAFYLSDFEGKYSLFENHGDGGQFTPKCLNYLVVEYYEDKSSVRVSFAENNTMTTGHYFQNINYGKYTIGGPGTYDTQFNGEKIVEKYRVGSYLNFSKFRRNTTLHLAGKDMIIFSIKSNEGQDMKCIYVNWPNPHSPL
ncbi:MAG: hypothetical protein KJN80_01190 [Deltaproteobacteria bacterium]|nr:hypothetical protein [Deltaproteobacteria bacterium]